MHTPRTTAADCARLSASPLLIAPVGLNSPEDAAELVLLRESRAEEAARQVQQWEAMHQSLRNCNSIQHFTVTERLGKRTASRTKRQLFYGNLAAAFRAEIKTPRYGGAEPLAIKVAAPAWQLVQWWSECHGSSSNPCAQP